MSPVTFREATVADASAIVKLVNSAYRGEASLAGWTTEAELLDGQRTDIERILEILNSNDQTMIVGFDGDRLVASVHLIQEDHICYLGMLAVQPTLQSRGIGRQLITYCEEFVKTRWSYDALHMMVISLRKELIEYYNRRGYLPTGATDKFPMDDPRYGLPKRRDFHLIVLRKSL